MTLWKGSGLLLLTRWFVCEKGCRKELRVVLWMRGVCFGSFPLRERKAKDETKKRDTEHTRTTTKQGPQAKRLGDGHVGGGGALLLAGSDAAAAATADAADGTEEEETKDGHDDDAGDDSVVVELVGAVAVGDASVLVEEERGVGFVVISVGGRDPEVGASLRADSEGGDVSSDAVGNGHDVELILDGAVRAETAVDTDGEEASATNRLDVEVGVGADADGVVVALTGDVLDADAEVLLVRVGVVAGVRLEGGLSVEVADGETSGDGVVNGLGDEAGGDDHGEEGEGDDGADSNTQKVEDLATTASALGDGDDGGVERTGRAGGRGDSGVVGGDGDVLVAVGGVDGRLDENGLHLLSSGEGDGHEGSSLRVRGGQVVERVGGVEVIGHLAAVVLLLCFCFAKLEETRGRRQVNEDEEDEEEE